MCLSPSPVDYFMPYRTTLPLICRIYRAFGSSLCHDYPSSCLPPPISDGIHNCFSSSPPKRKNRGGLHHLYQEQPTGLCYHSGFCGLISFWSRSGRQRKYSGVTSWVEAYGPGPDHRPISEASAGGPHHLWRPGPGYYRGPDELPAPLQTCPRTGSGTRRCWPNTQNRFRRCTELAEVWSRPATS